jgi:beta-keto acid cleavage enzyme
VNPIITASLTGPAATKKDAPAMPGNPAEIAEAVKRAYEAGAAVIHIHLRENDGFTTDLDMARRTVELCRDGSGARWAGRSRTRICWSKMADVRAAWRTLFTAPKFESQGGCFRPQSLRRRSEQASSQKKDHCNPYCLFLQTRLSS